MSLRFDHRTPAQRVRFGTGGAATALAEEVAERGARRILLIASPSARAATEAITAGLPIAVRWHEVTRHVPVALAEAARAAAAEHDVDLLICIGGGSAVGLAKAVALTTGVPIVAVPTTYAGSEATNVWGLTEADRKTTGTDDRVLPATVVYDAELTASLPLDLAVASGLNGVAHCVDSLWAPRADPISTAYATEGIRVLSTGLRRLVADPGALEGREAAQSGAYLAALAFAAAGSGMHHKICHVLGGAYDLPHAPLHAVVLPYVVAFNAPAAPAAAARIAQAFGADDALAGLNALRHDLGAPRALRDLGLVEADLPEAARLAQAAIPPSDPRPATVHDLELLLTAAWHGSEPDPAPVP